MAHIESVSEGLTHQATTSELAHKIEFGETLESIGERYRVSVEALKASNPQLASPERLYPGDVLTIPGQDSRTDRSWFPRKGAPSVKYTSKNEAGTSNSVSLSGDGVTVGRKTSSTTKTVTGETKDSEITRMRKFAESGGVSVNPNDGSVSLTRGSQFTQSVTNARGWGVNIGIAGDAKVTAGVKTEDEITTFKASADVSVTLSGGVSAPRAGVEVGHTDGIKGSYSVSMPEAAARNASLESVNPFDPSSMPEGTVIKLDGAQYTSNEFKLTFREIAAQTKITNEAGVSIAVEKTGANTVRVTAGPTEAIKAYNGVGVDFDKVSLMLGRNDKLSSATLKTGTFDLSTQSGQAAYNNFLVTGKMPDQAGPGVTDVATIEKLDYKSQVKLDAKLGPLSIGLEGAKNTGNTVVTTLPDGTVSRTAELQYDGNVPLSITQKWDANGTEIVSARQYAYTIDVDRNNAALLNTALNGSYDLAGNGPVKQGQTVQLTFTESQMRELMQNTRSALEISNYANHRFQLLSGYDIGTREYYTNTPFDFATGLARNMGSSDTGIASHLFSIADTIDGATDGNFSESIGAGVTIINSKS